MNLEKYPNLQAILNGTVAGSFRDWIAVRPELEKLVAETERLATREKELLKLPSISAPDDWLAEIERLKNVLRLVQRWGKDSRSVGAYEVFAEVTKALGEMPEHPLAVVDCTCVPCVCPPNHEDRCLGCGARTCLAHELAKGGVKT